MRLLLVHAHPVAESFSTAVFHCAVETLRGAGHKVQEHDLYAAGFDPVMSREERLAYHTPQAKLPPVADEVARLKWAEGLILVYPTWWYAQPAMLKGWIDRVWLPHETFMLPEPCKPPRGLVQNIRLLGGIATYGAPWLWVRWVGDPGRRIVMRGIRPLCHPRCRTFWLAHYRMDTSTPESRAAFLARVRGKLASLPA
jgi:putative NADPH-quinone reductase